MCVLFLLIRIIYRERRFISNFLINLKDQRARKYVYMWLGYLFEGRTHEMRRIYRISGQR